MKSMTIDYLPHFGIEVRMFLRDLQYDQNTWNIGELH
jgi:hypothetical protein